ncbi:hypothetical protein [Sorangium sp. So ce1024]|uniref:hypothetical protein n=1 Tax=Sorangium sp. So ce1024 TaxID=3133327 RepID=UPI003EFE3536
MSTDDCTCDGCRGYYPAAVRDAWAEQRQILEDATAEVAEAPPPRRDGEICAEAEALIRARFPSETPVQKRASAYRDNPRPQPKLPRRAPWWRLALWWARGGPRRLQERRDRLALSWSGLSWAERRRVSRLSGWDRAREENTLAVAALLSHVERIQEER